MVAGYHEHMCIMRRFNCILLKYKQSFESKRNSYPIGLLSVEYNQCVISNLFSYGRIVAEHICKLTVPTKALSTGSYVSSFDNC
jgi:hypothetical protein